MERRNSLILAAILTGLIVVLGGAALLQGAVLLTKHEGDAIHMSEIVLRMADGQVPHLDFMTPIGGLAAAPFAMFVMAGFGIGLSIIFSQILVAVILAPMAWRVGTSRFGFWPAVLFAGSIVVLALAMIDGGSSEGLSISMHYNRWAWAISFIALGLAVFEPRKAAPTLDGIVIGLCAAALVLIKATYAAVLIPILILALLMRQDWRALAVAFVAGLVVAAGVTLWLGPEYWMAYAGDLLTVAQSEIRSAPGKSFVGVLTAPPYRAGTLAALAAVIILRQSGREREGLLLLLLLPAFAYITYQNFGNDPQWLLFVAVLLLAALPDNSVENGVGWNMRMATVATSAFVIASIAPSYINMAYSPIAMVGIDAEEDYTPLLLSQKRHNDLLLARTRQFRSEVIVALDEPGGPLATLADPDLLPDDTSFQGETFPSCGIRFGVAILMLQITTSLEDAGFAQKKIFVADLQSFPWLFGDFGRLKNGSPWYYGGLPGWDDADYLLVPFCYMSLQMRREVLETLEETLEEPLEEVMRTELFVLYAAP
ncbi:hypothetical protein AADZ90_014575 [Aestuariibius sp. 2305UL40-4]|uniref:hypothetical protein n=1 Tax=Aestuariibius violaceus TaxID=3234132 RepID=UPI00345E1715